MNVDLHNIEDIVEDSGFGIVRSIETLPLFSKSAEWEVEIHIKKVPETTMVGKAVSPLRLVLDISVFLIEDSTTCEVLDNLKGIQDLWHVH